MPLWILFYGKVAKFSAIDNESQNPWVIATPKFLIKKYLSVRLSTLQHFKITLKIFQIYFPLEFNYLNIIAICFDCHNTFILDIWVSNATNGYRDIYGSSESQMHWHYFKWHLELYPNVTTFDVCEPNIAPFFKKAQKVLKLPMGWWEHNKVDGFHPSVLTDDFKPRDMFQR